MAENKARRFCVFQQIALVCSKINLIHFQNELI